MSGISYLVDDRGEKKAVVIDLDRHGALWEDIHDRLIVESRKAEPRETLRDVRKSLARRRGG